MPPTLCLKKTVTYYTAVFYSDIYISVFCASESTDADGPVVKHEYVETGRPSAR